MKMKVLLIQNKDGSKDWNIFAGDDVDERIEAVVEAYKKRAIIV